MTVLSAQMVYASPKKRLEQAAEPVKKQLTFAGILSVISALLWIGQAILVAWLFSSLVYAQSTHYQPIIVAVFFIVIGAVRAGLDAWSDKVVTEAANCVLALEREKLIKSVAMRSPVDTQRPSSAVIAALAAEKLETLLPYLTRYRPAFVRTMIVPLVLLIVSASQSWIVAIIFLVAGPLIPMFMALVGLQAQATSERQMDEISNLNDMLLERIQALVDIRLLHAGEAMISRFKQQADAFRRRTMAVLRIAFLSSAVLELFAALGVAMVAVYVGFSLLGDIKFGTYFLPLTIGQGVFLLMLAPAFFQPLRDLAAAWHDRAAALAVAKDLMSVEEAEHLHFPGDGTVVSPHLNPPDIKVQGLKISIGEQKTIISYPDFTVFSGQSVALIGPSGVGKSILLAAIAGLISPHAGEISVAGQPLNEKTADSWRARLSWLPQRPHFFSMSLRWNLLLGSSDRTQKQIDMALENAAAKGIVRRLPLGLATRLGEVGSGVSGGEARRLMIARTALEGRDVILADEPTADLDSETAAIVTDALLQLAKSGATLIVVTHDSALAARMEKQIVISGEEH